MRFFFGEREVASLSAFAVFFAIIMIVQIKFGTLFYERDVYGEAKPVTSVLYTTLFLAAGTSVSVLMAIIVYVTKTVRVRAEELAIRMTEDLSASRDQFKTLYENAPVPYLLIDEVGCIESPNKAALRFFGTTAEECAKYNLFELLNDEHKSSGFRSILISKVAHNVPINKLEVLVQTMRRSERWVLLSIFPLAATYKGPKQRLATLVDITEKKELEQAKAEFLSLASHQLRTPLTAVKWYIDLLRSSKSINVPDTVRTYLEKIYVGNQRMIDIVATLLNLSRLETGTLQIETRDTDMTLLVRDILDEIEPQRVAKQLTITSEIDTLHVIGSDPSLVRICIQNLLTNALRYTPQGGEVRMIGRCDEKSCMVQVADTGVGIPAQEQHNIFSKMYRAANARKVEAKGTGLGLYMTKAFVEKLGGSIEFASIEGKGSTFTLTIPDRKQLSKTLANEDAVYYHSEHDTKHRVTA